MQAFNSIILSTFLLFTALFCVAQKQNYQWRFGNQGGLSFLTSPPTYVNDAQLITGEGSASVADPSTGELLFYTDGVSVWNAQNQLMPNGTGLLGGDQVLLSSTTAAVIIPRPGSQTLYYIVTIDEQSSTNGVRYNLVDMTLDGGLGDIVAGQKNVPLFQTGSEKLEVVPAANGQDYWLITKDNPGNSFYAFLLTAAGFQTTPVVSTIGGTQGNGAGHLKVNRQFNKLACGSLFDGTMELFDFSNATGEVTGVISWSLDTVMLTTSPLIYGVEFSPSGQFLYISNLSSVVQYDVSLGQSASIQNSVYVLNNNGFSQPASLQLAPNQKIYLNTGSILEIAQPDSPGPACNIQPALALGSPNGGGYGLPKWVYFQDEPTIREILVTDSCANTFLLFTLTDTSDVQQIIWNYGDSSALFTQILDSGIQSLHIYSQPGNYTITAMVTTSKGIDTFFVTVPIVDCTTPCLGFIEVSGDSCLSAVFTFTAGSDQQIITSAWNFDDDASGTANFSSLLNPQHAFSSPGLYSVQCILELDCGMDTLYKDVSVYTCDDTLVNCALFVPNVFSPNGDGSNDLFEVEADCPFAFYSLQVFNRWGEKVFQSFNPSSTWSGGYLQQTCPVGVYVYRLQYRFAEGQGKSVQGTVTLIR